MESDPGKVNTHKVTFNVPAPSVAYMTEVGSALRHSPSTCPSSFITTVSKATGPE
jgi:hypothetical protein